MIKEVISYNDFDKIDLRVGTIIKAEVFEKARNPSYKLWIDFGNMGIKKSSAQITQRYEPATLIGKQIIAVLNFEPKQIADFMSEVLVLGVLGDNKAVNLLTPDLQADNGASIA